MPSSESVHAIVAQYLAEETPQKAPSTQRHDALYARVVIAAWGEIDIAEITPRRATLFHRALTVERGPILANRVLSFVSQLCALAERDDLRGPNSNPTRSVRRNTEARRTNFLSPELRARFLDAACAELAGGRITRSSWTLLCLMLLVGLRWSDARLLLWDEIDLKSGHIRFEPRGLKRRENKGTDQRCVPLSDEALALLSATPREGRFVAPAPRSGLPYTDIRKPLRRVCVAAGVKLTPHWLRHTFGTAAAESDLTPDQIATLLGQRSNASAGRYVHLAGRAARRAAQRAGAASIGRAA